ncbi:zinc-ribbon domain-containing protein [uncultured Roseovarius sp.]|uniref:zinc-ribbon domain-containing protein n=1 Tax=uncultured Roseovarius sp. TaxID=293344 RepID=UPI002619211B|nr:zinc-ribbon domain-containing protein [uncultured Roseovarius sp.]
MRLICPNCGAQYEVPDEVIPTGGRDVQCSNCGDTWFQQHPDHGTAASGDEDFGPEQPDASMPPPPEPEPELAPAADHEDTTQDQRGDEEPDDETQTVVEPQGSQRTRRTVDPAVADILRQEAARERGARAAATGIETQPDLGLTEPEISEDERTRQARSRMERLRGAAGAASPAEEETVEPDIDPSSRRNLLPDIEEINSSLTAADERPVPAMAPRTEETEIPNQRGGFRNGFRLAVVTFILAALVYVLAPNLAAMLPAAKAPLAQYVDAVNMARLWLNDVVGTATGWISGGATS